MRSILRLYALTMLILIFYCGAGFAQEQVIFCESVDDKGNPGREGTSFTIDRNGSYVYALVNLGLPCMSTYAYFYIYTVDSNGDKTLNDYFKMDTDEEWEWFYTDITFYDEGTYEIEVYDDTDYFLASGTIYISYE